MKLHELVLQVKEELKAEDSYDMRTFAYHHFEHKNGEAYDTVRFYVYEKVTIPNRRYVTFTYDLTTGHRLDVTMSNSCDNQKKKVVGFERQGQTYFFSDKKSESKVFATLISGKVTKLKELPEDDSSNAYKAGKLLQEIDAVERQVLSATQANFEDLRDFVHHNI